MHERHMLRDLIKRGVIATTQRLRHALSCKYPIAHLITYRVDVRKEDKHVVNRKHYKEIAYVYWRYHKLRNKLCALQMSVLRRQRGKLPITCAPLDCTVIATRAPERVCPCVLDEVVCSRLFSTEWL